MEGQRLLGPIEHSIVTELRHLQLEFLEKEWVKETIDNEFLECGNLPVAFEKVLASDRLHSGLSAAQKLCTTWLQTYGNVAEESRRFSTAEITEASSNNDARFWNFLFQEEKFDLQRLQALLGFLLEKGSRLSCQSEDRQRCFSAANFYLTLISIPGSMAFNVFHEMLYLKVLQLIQLYVQANKIQKSEASSKKSQKDQAMDVEDEGESVLKMTAAEAAAVESHMPGFLNTLKLVSQYLSFRRYPKVLRETIVSMLPMIGQGKGPISLKALEIIQQFCNPLHGDATQTVHYIFAHLLPYLALDPAEKDLNNSEVLNLKEVSFNLVKNFIGKFGEPIYPLVKGLIQHLCLEVVDRAEYRQRTAQTTLDLLSLVTENHSREVIHWFLLLAHSEQAYLRLFVTELMGLLLNQQQIDPLILAVLCNHCSDPSATVRAKALSILCDCIESRNPALVIIFDTIFSGQQQQQQDSVDVDLLQLLQSDEGVADPKALMPQAGCLLKLLEERATDEKVHVRKNALHLLLTVMKRYGDGRLLTKELLRLLGHACRDAALLVRRHMAQGFTELVLQYAEHVVVQRVWVRSVLPLILDGESRVQEKTLESLELLVLKPLTSAEFGASALAWSVLDIVTDLGFSTYLSKAVELWSRQKQLQPALLRILQASVEQHGNAAWTFLSIIARHMTFDNTMKVFFLEQMQAFVASTNTSNIYCMQQVLKTLAAILPTMKKDQQLVIRTTLKRPIFNFSLPTDLISGACDLVAYCTQQSVPDEEVARKETSQWAAEVLQNCSEYLSVHLRSQENVSAEEEEQLARRILTLGCAALHTPWTVNKRHFLMLQHAAFQPESGVDAPIPSSQSQPSRRLPPRLQAAAIISLGKLSVQNEEMAKQLIPGLGKLLETTPHEAVRNNIVCILCDWVVRYGTAVDPVMSQVTACLRDPSTSVRKQTLVLLIHLLQEDYLKIRGTFFFRILQLACDDDQGLRDLALFYVTQRLLHRQHNIIQQHFIECVFHFNDYKGHPSFNKFVLTDRERSLFSIAGPSHAKRRWEIYMFMLQNMDDESRFQLTFRLTRDVLLGVVEGTMPLKNPCTEVVLKEALAILASDDIKLASLTSSTDEDPIEKEDVAQAIVQSTKKAIIAQVVKRNVIENIVPIVVQLKRKLSSLKSPLMGHLMTFLRELMKDYKDEIAEVMDADKQLMAEIDFDLKRFEQQQKQERSRLEKSRASTAPEEVDSPATDPTPNALQAAPPAANAQMPSDAAEAVQESSTVDEAALQPHEAEPEPMEAEPTVAEPVEAEPEAIEHQFAQPAPQRRVKSRPLQPRIMSTPIRGNTNTDVTFRMEREADLSAIPFTEDRPKRRRKMI